MDTRLNLLSYSSLLTLHRCPRKFQLYRLNSKEIDRDGDVVIAQSVTFAFGSVVGEGIQEILRSGNIELAIWNMFLMWDTDLAAEDEVRKKSFYLAVAAVKRFAAMRDSGLLKDYEIVYHEGKPATELGFMITLPDGFIYRGFVDAVLRHKVSGKILVLELKTTSATRVDEAMYKNSAQAIGYSIVLDVLFPALSSYDVLYLVYMTKSMEYSEPLQFGKSYTSRAQWIQELLFDIELIKMYDEADIYPMRGESCFDWYKQCEYFGLCTLSTKNITKAPEVSPQEMLNTDAEKYAIKLTLADLLRVQLEKSNGV